MKILVIGGGGREHALVWKLAQSPQVRRIWCAPGNAGIALERLAVGGAPAECAPISAQDLPRLLDFALEKSPDLTVVGPDNPLALGIVDRFAERGLAIWGPTQRAAQFEWSKAFAQEFMRKYGIPTARAGAFSDAAAAKKFAAELGGRCAVKADGLALGKGVIVCARLAEAEKAINEMLVEKAFGDAGRVIVVQERLEGIEVSMHALCDGERAALFPAAQDHKRVREQNQGPNTGGMGSCSPPAFLSETEYRAVGERILERWLRGCAAEGIQFRGLLYPGLMLTASGPKVLEFNARFGDPETQVYMVRLDEDLAELLAECAGGALPRRPLRWNARAALCVVMASAGYPGNYQKGKIISGLTNAARMPNVKVFHAGTARAEEKIVTQGGRVLGVTAWGESLERARRNAYAAVEQIEFDGAQYRRDIGLQAMAKAEIIYEENIV